MTDQSWSAFDEELRINLQQLNEPRAQASNRMPREETVETDNQAEGLTNE